MKENMQNEPCGVLLINKPRGITSHDVVNKVRRLFGTRRVGHTGTLDPMATGVLVILIGRAAKACEYLVTHGKTYRAMLRLGLTTDTEDVTGKVLSESQSIPSYDKLMEVLPNFLGEIEQIPPMYSALKVGGKKLVDLARQGEVIERQPRKIEIFSLTCRQTESPTDYLLEISCSGGTYIRTLCADIGQALGCGGVMASLERTEVGGYSIDNTHTLEELEGISLEERLNLLFPTESLFQSLPAICLEPFYERLIRSGCTVEARKLGVQEEMVGVRFRLCSADNHFFALGEMTEEGIKSIKLFEL